MRKNDGRKPLRECWVNIYEMEMIMMRKGDGRKMNSAEIRDEYLNVRKKVYSALRENGYCEDVDQVISKAEEPFNTHPIHFWAVEDAYCAFIEDRELDPEGNLEKNRKGYRWHDLNNGSIVRYILIEYGNEARKHFDEINGNDSSFFDSKIDETSHKDASYGCIRESDSIKRKAEEEAEEIKKLALIEKERIIAQAKSEAKFIIEEAEIQKIDIIAEADRKKEKIISESLDDAFQDILRRRLNNYFVENNSREEEIRIELRDEYDALIQARSDTLDSFRENAQGVQNSLRDFLEETVQKIRGIQNEIQNEVDGWQRSLHNKKEAQELAFCYVNLCKIIAGMERRIATELSFGDESYHAEFARELEKHARNLRIFKDKFQKVLPLNGIKIFTPEIGEAFNSYYHIAENIDSMTEDVDCFNNRPITSCKESGISFVTNSGEEPLFKAVVTVEK